MCDNTMVGYVNCQSERLIRCSTPSRDQFQFKLLNTDHKWEDGYIPVEYPNDITLNKENVQ